MGPWTLITILVAVQVSAAWSEECNDPCFCPVGQKTADCSNRGLSQPPPGYWPEIRILDLRRNNISDLTKWSLTGFPNVEDIKLEGNLLTELDLETFSALPFLSEVDLYLNAITTITPLAPGLTIGSLQYLILDNNSISSLDPNAFLAVTDLRLLFLSNNPVEVQAGQPILNHPTLEVLQLESGSPLVLGPQSLAGLPAMTHVSLLKMGITSIDGAFVNNPLLTDILLAGNLITEVNAGTFSSGNAIRTLDLSYNPLERLDVAALENAVVIPGAFVVLVDTPLACSCGYGEIHRWAKERGVHLLLHCSSTINCFFA